jgi:hypothetical protein
MRCRQLADSCEARRIVDLLRLGFALSIGPIDHLPKIKNPAAPVTKREAEEEWQ